MMNNSGEECSSVACSLGSEQTQQLDGALEQWLQRERQREDPERSTRMAEIVKDYDAMCERIAVASACADGPGDAWKTPLQEIQEAIEKSNANYGQLLGSKELKADANLMWQIATSLRAQLSATADSDVTAKHGIRPQNFLQKLFGSTDDEDSPASISSCDQVKLGLSHTFCRSILNAIVMENAQVSDRVRAQRQCGRREELVNVVGASEPSSETGSKLDNSKRLDRIMECLRNELRRLGTDRMGYWQFVLHPTNFSKTVENMFNVSFLLTADRVRLHIPAQQIPWIEIAASGTGTNRTQTVMSIEPKSYRKLVAALNITKPVIMD